jgi:uncharacterized protein
MFIPFLYVLREHGVPVGAQEALNLAQAMARGLHQNSLDEFYHLARCLTVHRESHLDAFDAAFYAHFHGVQWQSLQLQSELLDWLEDPKQAQDLEGLLAGLDPEELRRQFEERLQEQTERHDGGSKWIGTGGRSPFGHSGAKQPGIRVGGKSRHRSAIHVAGERRFANYRNDRQLDVRQYGVALRKLRSFARDGNDLELDVEDTIEATAQNAGELELVLKAPRRPNTRVILMMDVGGSMDSHIYEVERLFSAAAASTHFKEFRSYYFHNCIYDKLFLNADFTASISLKDFLRGLNKTYRLVMIGDAAMAPYELFNPKGQYFFRENKGAKAGWESMVELAAFFERAIWLNPEDPKYWQGIGSTREAIARIFPMYPLTVDGLDEAIKVLNGKRPPRLMPLQDLF